jgi:hypothetical protein
MPPELLQLIVAKSLCGHSRGVNYDRKKAPAPGSRAVPFVDCTVGGAGTEVAACTLPGCESRGWVSHRWCALAREPPATVLRRLRREGNRLSSSYAAKKTLVPFCSSSRNRSEGRSMTTRMIATS